MTINKREAIRYLGFGKQQPDEVTIALIDQCAEEISQTAECRHTVRRFPLTFSEDGMPKAAGIELQSRSLARNLLGCEEVIFMAATLGPGPDRLMNLYSKIQISKAAVLQATAAAAIEDYCNSIQRDIEKKINAEGLSLRPRYSPGYGDLSLAVQPEFLNVLDAAKQAGIVLSEGGVMIPEKSVTAIMGISRINSKCHIEGCESCNNTDCAFRRN